MNLQCKKNCFLLTRGSGYGTNRYTMSTRGLSDINTRSLRAAGPRASGVHIRQITRVCGITITWKF